MNREREKFEALITAPPFGLSAARAGCTETFDGYYTEYIVSVAWEMWQESRSACKEEDAGICDAMQLHGGRAWSLEQSACNRCLADASKNILASK